MDYLNDDYEFQSNELDLYYNVVFLVKLKESPESF